VGRPVIRLSVGVHARLGPGLQEKWRVDRRFLEPFTQFTAAATER